MNIKLLATYATTLTALSELLVANRTESKHEADARDARKGGLVDTLRLLATETHRDGVTPTEASDMLRLTLSMMKDSEDKPVIPGGTVKNYCAALRGYHAMLARGEAIGDKSTKDATDEVASDEAKAIKAAKEQFAKLTKKYTSAQWIELVDLIRPVASAGEAEATDEEQGEVEAAVKAA